MVAPRLLLGTAIALGAVACQGNGASVRPEQKAAPPRVVRVRDLAVRVPTGTAVVLRAKPGGSVLARLGSRTAFGSPQTLAVVFRKGPWLAVRTAVLGNDEVGWVDAGHGRLSLLGRAVRIEVDLSERTLSLIENGTVHRGGPVAIGAAETPTPTGEFYVTDKLRGADFGPYYGCCILALSGRQPHLPRGWSGGDRLAIHGTRVADFGRAATNGCLHLPNEFLHVLMNDVPLGTAVEIHA
jgi:lipoprotein-anchoring transpeptidase ErfK/SrfK